MPEGRFLSKSIAWSEQVNSVSLEADYLFTRMIPHLDREGRISDGAKAIKAMCVPLRDEIRADMIDGLLDELVKVGLIVRYSGENGEKAIQFPGFLNHQRGARLDREAPSRLPTPAAVSPRGQRRRSAKSREQVRSNSGVTPPKRSEVKRSRSEVKRSEGSSSLREETPEPPANGATSWPGRISETLAKRGITAKPGRVGALLKAAVDLFGEAKVTEALEDFLENGVALYDQKPEFVTLETFARNPAHWVELNTPLDQLTAGMTPAERDAKIRAAAGIQP